ncbi:MAG TPA: hypothetical protein PKN61_02730 [Acidobacteriota bacterium]|jgi:MFS family permease|nr:hypothetical protein [Acidobacteriota bacterium]HNR37930.1 hypothetical protein [Acidobacteriota bacterium]HNU00372.1 hypothetical protein [Acidobacteriota bacterium]HPB29482.1 hypothetical protein [Acidobacteriota bacterium]HQO24644.1 hypothetical protein [Acidobacteriota bacterium]
MLRIVLAVIAGYLAMAVFVFATFSAAYLIIGTEGSFRPGSFDVSKLWIVVSIVLSIVAALVGGWVCARIGRRRAAVIALAVVVVALGLAVAAMEFTHSGEPVPAARSGEISNFDAMQMAQQPLWLTLLNPFLGAAGVLLGARLRRPE